MSSTGSAVLFKVRQGAPDAGSDAVVSGADHCSTVLKARVCEMGSNGATRGQQANNGVATCCDGAILSPGAVGPCVK